MPAVEKQIGNDEPLAGIDLGDTDALKSADAPKVDNTPEQPKKEAGANDKIVPMVDDGKTASIDDFTALKDGIDLTKHIAPKPKDEKKEPVKEAAVDKKDGKSGEPSKQTAKDPNYGSPRDFTGIDEQHVEHFKRMSRDAFELIRPIYLEQKKNGEILKAKDAEIAKRDATITELKKGGIPQSYYENPDAYILHPDYIKAAQRVDNADRYLAFYSEQLEKVRRGEPIQTFVSDGKGGFVLSEPRAVLPSDEAGIIRAISNVSSQKIAAENVLNNIATSFRQTIDQDVAFIKEQEDKFFPAYKDEKSEVYKLVNATMEAIPSSFRQSPLARILAKSIAGNLQQQKMIEILIKENEGLQGKIKGVVTAKDKKDSGPTEEDNGGGSGGGVGSSNIMEEFASLKN